MSDTGANSSGIAESPAADGMTLEQPGCEASERRGRVGASGREKAGAILVALFAVAWVLRVGLAAWTGPYHQENHDALGHYSTAVGLIEGRGMSGTLPNGDRCPSAFKMPLPTILLAFGMRVFGTSEFVARMVAISFSSMAAPLMYLIAATIMPRRWAVLAGFGCAFQPAYVFYSILTLTEPFYVPLLLLAVLLSVHAIQNPGFATAFIDGLVWGVAALCRPHAVPALVLTAIGMGLIQKSWRPVLGIFLGTAIVLTPWWARNLAVFGKPILLSLEGGETFLGANNPYVANDPDLVGMWISPMTVPEYRARIIRSQTEIELNDCMMEMAVPYLKANPHVIPRLVFNKWARWLTPITSSGGLNRLMVLCTYGVLLALVALGLISRTIRYSPLLVATVAITLADFATVGLYWGNLTRGRIALELIWLPWGVQTFRLLIAAPLAGWYRRKSGGT